MVESIRRVRFASLRFALLRFALHCVRIGGKSTPIFAVVYMASPYTKCLRRHGKFATRFAVVYMARHSQFITVYGSPFDLEM